MKKLIYIVLCALTMVSCGSRKTMSTNIVDKDVEIYQRALQRSRDKFYALDSANAITQDLGWAKRIVKAAKISGNAAIPSVFKIVNNESFTIELPCWEDDTDEYLNANVIVEHSRLDSALVKAKMQGIDEIYIRNSVKYLESSIQTSFEHSVDSIDYLDDYADYAIYARLSCVCVSKIRNNYVVNATINVPKMKIEATFRGRMITEEAETPSK